MHEEYHVNALLYAMKDATDDIVNVLPMSAADKKKCHTVKAAMEQHFIGKHNVIFERVQLTMTCKHDGESAEAFITEVHKLAEHCSFGLLKDELVRDQIVVGIKDRK